MPTQTLGKIRVVVNNDDRGSLVVRQSNQFENKVKSISYGQPLEIRKATDLDMSDANTGEAVVYNATTNTFEVAPVGVANTVVQVYGGTF